MASYEELRSYARIIRNETKSSANTALRIGEMYLNIIDKMEDVDDRFKDFLTGTDTDNIINRWKELESFLTGYTETATLADLLSGKADKATTLAGYGITNAYTKTEVDNKITSVNTSVTTLQTTVSGHTTSINSLQNTVSGHTSSITSINSKITTLQGYFENGVAKSALRLSDGAEYKAWGKTFFKDGKPVNVSGAATFTQVNADSVLLGGKARLSYDSNLNALLLTKVDGTAVHFLASGAVATRGLGEIEEGGGGTGTGVDLLNVPSDIIPSVGSTYNLGTSGKPWKELFVGDIQSENIMPSSHYTYSLGADENRWSKIYGVDIYATRFTMNGEAVATRNWVNSQLSSYATTSALSSYATNEALNSESAARRGSTLSGAQLPNGQGYSVTWQTSQAGAQTVNIPTFGSLGYESIDDYYNKNGWESFLVDGKLMDSLLIYIEDAISAGGNVDLSNYVTLNSAQTISGRKTFTGGITASHLYSVEYLDSSELTINAEKVNFIYDGDDADVQIGLINGYKPLTIGNTSFSPALTSGTVIGTITIGGESKTIYAPNGGSADLSNYVTLDGEQTITGGKYFSDLNANSIYLQGFELKPYSPDGRTPDRLMYDGGVLLDEYNYGEYLDDAYIKKSGGTVTGQLTSTVADGTAPFVVASKTLVKNLNSEYVNGYIPTSGVVSNFLEGKRFTLTDETAQTWYIKITCGNWNSAEIDISVQTHYDGWNNGVVFTINGLDKLRYRTTFYNKFNILGYKLVHPSGGYTYLYLQVRGYYKDANNYAKAIIATSTKSSVFTAEKVTEADVSDITWDVLASNANYTDGQIISSVANGTAPFVVASKTEVANLHSATATKLHTARTLWGQSFDGSGNVSGALSGVTTITGASSSSLLIHSSGSQSIGLAYNGDGTKAVALDKSSFRPYSTANGLLDLGSTSARWKWIYGQSLGLSGGATIRGSLSLANDAPEILFYREGESSWKILNYSNGNFYIQNNYTTAVQSSYFTVLQLNRNTGNTALKGSLTTGGNILPSTNNGANIGQSDRRWLNGYIDNLHSDVIYADTLTSRTSPYLNVTAASLDLISCELYGYDSDGNANWNIASNGIASFNSVVISSNDHIHTINGNTDGELVIWPSEYLVIENDTITDYAITCSELVQTSDIRYKNILSNVYLKLSDIAAAPTFRFSWANETDGSTHIGTSAQYWQEIAGELVVKNKKTGKLGLDYSTAALVSAVSIAREVNTMKMLQASATDRIEELEDKVKKLEEENKALRELLNNK